MSDYINITNVSDLVNAVNATFKHWVAIHNDAQSFADNTLEHLDDRNGNILTKYLGMDNVYITVLPDECVQYYLDTTTDLIYDENEDLVNTVLSEIYEPDCITELSLFDAERVTKEYLFPRYFDALSPLTLPITETLREYMLELEQTQTNEERVRWLVKALAVAHVHGNVFEDYGSTVSDFDFNDFNNLRNNGLESMFSRDEVIEYLSS